MPNGKFESLEEADVFVKALLPHEQAYIYRALYLNGMRIDEAERIIRDRRGPEKAGK
ncbi:MAG TPA: hypothetical protein VNL14_14030 [Candidatus Acidoferrales bacterium]|nr:hypothetical protein [Candidatus Acidoferrales bacterium]